VLVVILVLLQGLGLRLVLVLALYSASFGRVSGICSSPNRNLRIVTEVARTRNVQL